LGDCHAIAEHPEEHIFFRILHEKKGIVKDLTYLIVIGIGAMLTLTLGIILFVVMYQRRVIRHQIEIKQINEQKQQELVFACIQSEEEERMRIASELHDNVAPTLASIKLFLSTAAQKASPAELINESKQLLDDSLQNIRNISHKLQPSTLHYLGLQISLQALADLINRSERIKVSYMNQSKIPRFDDSVELSIYRIVQELMNNIIKHANAGSVTIQSGVYAHGIEVILTHNGKGITQEMYQDLIYKKGAIGLKNIVNRIKSINALIHFNQQSPEIFSIRIEVPITLSTTSTI
jgi:signal transduction histidine kinase